MALVTALAELDEFSADAHCMHALTSAAERLTGVLHAGKHVPVHCLCQVGLPAHEHEPSDGYVQQNPCSILILLYLPVARLSSPVGFRVQSSCGTWKCLLQVVAAVAMSRTLQKSFKPLMNMCITALEPQLDKCRCGMRTALCATPFHDCIWQRQGCRCAVWALPPFLICAAVLPRAADSLQAALSASAVRSLIHCHAACFASY